MGSILLMIMCFLYFKILQKSVEFCCYSTVNSKFPSFFDVLVFKEIECGDELTKSRSIFFLISNLCLVMIVILFLDRVNLDNSFNSVEFKKLAIAMPVVLLLNMARYIKKSFDAINRPNVKDIDEN